MTQAGGVAICFEEGNMAIKGGYVLKDGCMPYGRMMDGAFEKHQ